MKTDSSTDQNTHKRPNCLTGGMMHFNRLWYCHCSEFCLPVCTSPNDWQNLPIIFRLILYETLNYWRIMSITTLQHSFLKYPQIFCRQRHMTKKSIWRTVTKEYFCQSTNQLIISALQLLAELNLGLYSGSNSLQPRWCGGLCVVSDRSNTHTLCSQDRTSHVSQQILFRGKVNPSLSC